MTVAVRRGPTPVTKSPLADQDFGFKWHKWLQSGETITVSTWIISPTGELSTDLDAISVAGDITTIWLQDGVAGENYLVTNHVTTSLTREDDRTMRVHVVDR